jgi:hypothetical protein
MTLFVPIAMDVVEARQTLPVILGVERTIEVVRYARLKKQLTEAVNPELNADKELLVSRMEELGFRREIVTSLGALDRKLYAAGTPLDFKGCMDLLRTIFEEIVEDAGQRAATKVGETPPAPGGRDFAPWKQLLLKCGVLTADEAELFQKLYNYVSNTGTHRLGSAPEQVRISKNTVVEFGVLLVGRVQQLLGSP